MSLRYGFWTYATSLAVAIPASLFKAYTLATCWMWFAVPLGLPAVGWAHAYGIGLLATLAVNTDQPIKDADIASAASVEGREATTKEARLYWLSSFFRMTLKPTITLIAAYVVHSYIGKP